MGWHDVHRWHRDRWVKTRHFIKFDFHLSEFFFIDRTKKEQNWVSNFDNKRQTTHVIVESIIDDVEMFRVGNQRKFYKWFRRRRQKSETLPNNDIRTTSFELLEVLPEMTLLHSLCRPFCHKNFTFHWPFFGCEYGIIVLKRWKWLLKWWKCSNFEIDWNVVTHSAHIRPPNDILATKWWLKISPSLYSVDCCLWLRKINSDRKLIKKLCKRRKSFIKIARKLHQLSPSN